MKKSVSPIGSPGRRIRFLLIVVAGMIGLSAGSALPPAHASTGNRLTVTQSVSQVNGFPLTMKSLPSPVTLQDFTRHTISKLSADTPFQDWADADTEYYPLGPGTHSWLVNVMNGKQRIGYLIITAAEPKGYVLSEYGAGTYGLPYSLTELRQYLVQEELIHSSYSGKLELEALYAPLLPVWKITLDHTILYINASVPQLLPWSLSEAGEVFSSHPASKNLLSSLDTGRSPLKVVRSGGPDNPYKDLQWLTLPELNVSSNTEFEALLALNGSLAFQSSGRNDHLGAPFMITGFQRWNSLTAGTMKSTDLTFLYAAVGLQGKRFLPLRALQENGTLHPLSKSTQGSPTLAAAIPSKK